MFATLLSLPTLSKKLQTGQETNGDPLFVARGKVGSPKTSNFSLKNLKVKSQHYLGEQHFYVGGEDESQIWIGLLALWWRGKSKIIDLKQMEQGTSQLI